MKLWLILLGVAMGLGIALRRVLRRQSPLSDELYSQQVAVAHVQSGIAWVRGDLTFGSVNQSFADTLKMAPRDFAELEWYKIFRPGDHARIREAYGQMMLRGMTSFEAACARSDGSLAWLDVRLVPVRDGHLRFVGHHCMISDKSRERELEQQVRDLEERLEQIPRAMQPAAPPIQSVNGSSAASSPTSPSIAPNHQPLDALRRATGRSVVGALNSLRKSTTLRPVLPLTEKR
jgi:PAS domain-containing protein